MNPFLLPFVLAQIPVAEGIIVREFLREARLGLDPNFPLPPADEEQGAPSIKDSDLAGYRTRHYQYHYRSADILLASNRIVAYYAQPGPGNGHDVYEGDGMTPRSRQVKDRDAAAIAQRLYNAAEWPGTIKVLEVRDLMGTNDTCVQVTYVPTYRGVRFSRYYEESMNLERQTGLLETFSALGQIDIPTPPTALAPAGTPEDARWVATRAVLAKSRAASARPLEQGFDLQIWRPGRLEKDDTDPSVRAAYAARRGILAYVGTVVIRPGLQVDLVVDAQTGGVLRYEVLDLAEIGPRLGGGLAMPKQTPLAVPSGVRPWRLSSGEQGWNAWSAPAKATLTWVLGKPVKGREVVLTDGKLALAATYNAKTNLLGIGDKAYRPGPALAALLKKRVKA